MLNDRQVGNLEEWLNEVIAEGALPEEEKQAKELLEKQAEYKPLAKVEELEECNYNMIDNVLAGQVLGKLEAMSDAEFAEVALEAAE